MAMDTEMILIRGNALFSQISDEEYDSLNLIHHFKETAKGDYIYFESHLHNALYFLKEGFVKIGYIDKDGNEVIKEILGKGDVFGQMTLLPNNLEGEFAKAYKTDVSLCMFRISDFEKLLKERPDIALRYGKQMGEKMARLENRMINLLQRDVKSRLYYFFHNLTIQFAEYRVGNSFEMPNILTHEDVASLIASTRQTVTTLINLMAAEDLIDFSRKAIKIPNMKELQKRITVR